MNGAPLGPSGFLEISGHFYHQSHGNFYSGYKMVLVMIRVGFSKSNVSQIWSHVPLNSYW